MSVYEPRLNGHPEGPPRVTSYEKTFRKGFTAGLRFAASLIDEAGDIDEAMLLVFRASAIASRMISDGSVVGAFQPELARRLRDATAGRRSASERQDVPNYRLRLEPAAEVQGFEHE